MNVIELGLIGMLILDPRKLSRIGDFAPADFELRALFNVIELWADAHRDRIDDGDFLCEEIHRFGHTDIAYEAVDSVVDEALFDEYLEAWRDA